MARSTSTSKRQTGGLFPIDIRAIFHVCCVQFHGTYLFKSGPDRLSFTPNIKDTVLQRFSCDGRHYGALVDWHGDRREA